MARRWNLYDTPTEHTEAAMYSKFRLEPEPVSRAPTRETPDSASQVSWSRSPSAHYLPPLPPLQPQNLQTEERFHLPHAEANWTPGVAQTPYQSPRHPTPYQPSYTQNDQYYTPGPMIAPSQISPTANPRPMLPPPRARSVILKSVEESPGLESPSPAPEQQRSRSRPQSQSQTPRTHGRHLDPREDLLLVETCNKNSLSYGIKDGITEFWSKIEADFQDIVQRNPPYKSVKRRVAHLVEQRKKEIADWVTGDERKEDNWTHAIDEWIETVELYDLEQENSHRENTTLKTQKAIGNMKRINMMNIHSEKRSLEEFMEDLDDEDEESTRERDIDQRDLSANYEKSPPLPDDEIFSREPSPLSDDEPHVVNSRGVSSNADQHRESSSMRSQKNRKEGTASVQPKSSLNKRAEGRLKAAKKHQKALDKAEKARKALNPKKPKRNREERASDTDAPLTEMAKTFKSFVEYLKESSSSNHHATSSAAPSAMLQATTESAAIAPVAMASAAMATPSHVQEELKEMKSMLLTLVSSIGGIGNSNYQRSEDNSSGSQKKDEEI